MFTQIVFKHENPFGNSYGILCLVDACWSFSNAADQSSSIPPPDLLTGDVRTACEAILCLSTGERPHECSAPLRRYFSIKHKKLHDTIKARKNFLQLCPSDDAGMHGFIDALANGAGRCDADELNRVMRRRASIC